MAGDRPRQPAYEMFSIKRRFQQSKSRTPRFNRQKPAQAGVKDGYLLPLLKIVILPLLARVAWKRLRIDVLLITTSNSDKLFIDVNIDDLNDIEPQK